jgi:hypothetical protein
MSKKSTSKPNPTPTSSCNTKLNFYSVFHIFMIIIAIYLSYKCDNTPDYKHAIAIVLCPHFYIVYLLFTKGTCGLLDKKTASII